MGDMTNICFDCQRATGECPWSALDPETGEPAFRPVPGWTAEPVRYAMQRYDSDGRMMYDDSFHITACPLYLPDPPRESSTLQMELDDLRRLLKRWDNKSAPTA